MKRNANETSKINKKKKNTIYRIRDTDTRTRIQTQTRKNNKDAKA